MRATKLDKTISVAILLTLVVFAYVTRDVCLPGTCAAAAQPTVEQTPPVPPVPPDTSTAFVSAAYDSRASSPAKAKPGWTCKDKLAQTLYQAGFTGYAHKQAWAVVMRESNGQNLIPGHWAFNGEDWGIWQINEGAWGGQRWFTYANMSDPVAQSRIAWRYMTKKGTYWRPWGLTASGELDATHYQSWGPGLWEAWIMEPFRRYSAQYPCKTFPPSKGK